MVKPQSYRKGKGTMKRSKISRRKTMKSRSMVRIPISDSDEMKKFGYTNVRKMTVKERHEALMRMIHSKGMKKETQKKKSLSVLRRLNALAILTKNTSPEFSKIVKKDSEFVGKYYHSL